MLCLIRHQNGVQLEFHATIARSILVTSTPGSSRGCSRNIVRVGRVGEDVTRMLRGFYEETAVVEFRLIKRSTGQSVCLCICLSHAHSSKTARFRATATIAIALTAAEYGSFNRICQVVYTCTSILHGFFGLPSV